MVQCTTRDHVSNRVAKIADHPNTPTIRKSGIRIVVHGWGKLASSKQMECRVVDCS